MTNDAFLGAIERADNGSPLIDSTRVEGTKVFDLNGKDIGAIKRLVIEKVSGRVVYVIATFGGFFGVGGNDYTIPWSKLTYDVRLGGYQTDITKEQLTGAPAFARDSDWTTMDREHERAFNEYYGADPYW
jgi:sporulation protein YlmC with PRC-barrel domain